MIFTEALQKLAETADVLRNTRAKLEKYTEAGVAGDELAAINYKVDQLSRHVAEESANLMDTLAELDNRMDLRKAVIEKLKCSAAILIAWVEIFEEANANSYTKDTWQQVVNVATILSNHVHSCDRLMIEHTEKD